MKEAVRAFLSKAIVGTGVAAIGRGLFPKRGAIVLMGHRVTADDEGYLPGLDPSWFSRHLEYLCREYEPLALSRLIETAEQGQCVPEQSFVLTFDDGFRDNYVNAFHRLKAWGVPATIFVATDCLDRGVLPWPQRLGYLFQNTEAERISHGLLGDLTWDAGSDVGRRAGYDEAQRAVRVLPRMQREMLLDDLELLLRVQAPRDRMLTWGMCREMQEEGIEFGAHTVSHPLLALMPLREARAEMLQSRQALYENLGLERPPFAFPGGSMSARLVDMAKDLGFSGVFQSSPWIRVNGPGLDPFSLSRVGIPNAPVSVLEAELDGPFHSIRKLAYRVAGSFKGGSS